MFGVYEQSRQLGRPIELYMFRMDDMQFNYFAYTNAERPITFVVPDTSQSVVFNPLPISRDSFTVSGTLDRQDLNLTVPHDSEVPESIRLAPPFQSVRLTIYQGHANDPDANFLPSWNGRVTAITRRATTATITCQALFTSLRRQGLRRNYQYGCPHVLYGPSCRADKTAASHAATVTSVFTGIGIGHNTGGALFPTGILTGFLPAMAGGTLEFTTGTLSLRLTIVLATDIGGATQIFLARPPPTQLVAGQAVELVEGCNHAMSGCNGHVSTQSVDAGSTNIHNYGGQAWIPTKNPVGQYNAFY